ncbi:GWxTD domain-containing protein [Fodinibius sp. Rm-B-1B1-1]|uniref:GWxTD domain-containing protein n=1 Tax=Fodinibius alkaliphilus TaxID=3140241 RepID=UPI003159E03B
MDALSKLKWLSAYIVILGAGLIGCAKSMNPDIERGSSYNFLDGLPEVRFSAIGLIDDQGAPKIDLAADLVLGSLIYNKEGDQYVANVTIDVQIINKSNPDNVSGSNRYTVAIEREDPNIVYSQQVHTFEKEIQVDPGEYTINFTLTDQNSDKKVTHSTNTYLPNPENNIANLTNIRMEGKNMSEDNPEWSPITTYDVPGRVDSLKFIFQVTNNKSNEPLTIDSQLLRFESDTTYARPMHYNNYSPSSIQYKGIDYDEEEVIQSTQRKLVEPGNVLIEFTFANQRRGNYRFEVQTNKSSDDSDESFKARDFSVKSKNYPSIKSAEELAQPLIYLMSEKDYENLMAIENADSLKQAVDRFWLRNIGNRGQGRSVIKKFYNRVEEANKQFSNFKEGWKTDPGMMYILLGPPWYVNERLDEMFWSYSYNRSDPERNFSFYEPRNKNEFFPFDHYLLRRSQSYFTLQYQQIDLWLSGSIMRRNL